MNQIPTYFESKGLLGDVKNYAPDPIAFLKRGQERAGDLFQFRVAHRKLIYSRDETVIEHVLYKNLSLIHI